MKSFPKKNKGQSLFPLQENRSMLNSTDPYSSHVLSFIGIKLYGTLYFHRRFGGITADYHFPKGVTHKPEQCKIDTFSVFMDP